MSRRNEILRAPAALITFVLVLLGAGCSSSEPDAGGSTTVAASTTVTASQSSTSEPDPSSREPDRPSRGGAEPSGAEAERSSNAAASEASQASEAAASQAAANSAAESSAAAVESSVLASKSAAETAPRTPARELFGAPDLTLTLDEIQTDVGTDLQFFTIFVSADSLTVQAIDPAAPDTLLSRQWFEGGMGRAAPYPNDWDPAFLQSIVFTRADFDVTSVAAAAAAAPVDSGLTEAAVDSISIGRSGNIFIGQGSSLGCDVCIVVKLNGTGGSPTLFYDTNATLVSSF